MVDGLIGWPNPKERPNGDRMASQLEVIGNLALSVTRDWEFMAGAGVEPTTIPREGDPFLGIHRRKTPLHHPPSLFPRFWTSHLTQLQNVKD